MPGFGHPSRFQCVIPALDGQDPKQRLVDVYAAGRWLTCDDNTAYTPHFAGCLAHAAEWILRNDESTSVFRRPFPELSPAEKHRKLLAAAKGDGDNTRHLQYRFIDWGPTALNGRAHLFVSDGIASSPFSFWRPGHHEPTGPGQIFVAELPERELVRVLHQAAWELV